MLVAGVFSFIGDGIQNIIVGIFLLIDSLVYTIISWLYQLFLVLSSFRLFESDMYESITSSIYAVIGVVILFLLAYELLKLMINPDQPKGGEVVKKMIVNLVTSMILFLLVPTIFNFLFDFQNSILANNVLGKIMLPTYNSDSFKSFLDAYGIEDTENISEHDYNYYTLKYYGSSMATQLWETFFYPTGANTETFSSAADEIKTGSGSSNFVTSIGTISACGLAIASATGVTIVTGAIGAMSLQAAAGVCAASIGIKYGADLITDMLSSDYALTEAYNASSIYGDFSVFQKFADNVIENEITYHYLLSTVMGIVVVYILLIYCIDLGVRAVKLAFYEIIAPIPIFLRIVPKQEKVFHDWLRSTLSTFFEVFMRMFILYLGVFFISWLPSIMGNIFGSNSAYSENVSHNWVAIELP